MTADAWNGYSEAVRGLVLLEQARGKLEATAQQELARRQERIAADAEAVRERAEGWVGLADEAAADVQRACEQAQVPVPTAPAVIEPAGVDAIELTRRLQIARTELHGAVVDLSSQRRVERRRRDQQEQARAERLLLERQQREAAARRNRMLAIVSAAVALLVLLLVLLL